MFAALVRCVMLSNSSTSLTPRSDGPFSWATPCKGCYTKQHSKCNFFRLNLIRKFCLFIYLFFNLMTAWTNKRDLLVKLASRPEDAELTAHGRMNQSLPLGTKNKMDVWIYWISRITLFPPFLCWEDMVWEALRTPGNPASDKWGLEIGTSPLHLLPCPALAETCHHTGSQATGLALERLRLLHSPATVLKPPGEKAGTAELRL